MGVGAYRTDDVVVVKVVYFIIDGAIIYINRMMELICTDTLTADNV